MAETPPSSPPPLDLSPPSSPPPPLFILSNHPPYTQSWCYECDKRVVVEARLDHPNVICSECKNGFVDSTPVSPSYRRGLMDNGIPPLSNDIIQFLRVITNPEDDHDLPLTDAAADDTVHDLPLTVAEESNGNNDNDHEDEDVDDENRNQGNRDRDGPDDENEEDELRRRQRRHLLRLRLREHGLSAGRHDRILDWAELLLQLEDQSVTFGLQRIEIEDGYIGNRATRYDSLLQNVYEIDGNETIDALPASKSAVEALQTVEVNTASTEVCAVCKDGVFTKEEKIVKQLPCGHMYHGVCIMRWLESRNTCPICRHELPTDDPEYEKDRQQRSSAAASTIDHDS